MKYIKRVLASLLTATMIVGAVPVFSNATTDTSFAKDYKNGDVIEFGMYPQSRVTSSSTLFLLKFKILNWKSYNYCYGKDLSSSTMQMGNYMKYADVTLNGEKYRAVKFTEYRPYWSYYLANTAYSYLDENGYYKNTIYWFKYEPIKWRILDISKGLMMCENIVDAQYYSIVALPTYKSEKDKAPKYFTNNYEQSSIRHWLNNDFYQTAFNDEEKAKIESTYLDNSAYHKEYSMFNSNKTNDNVFLLSWEDMKNAKYGFDTDVLSKDEKRTAKGTDYARCQGLYTYNYGQTSEETNYSWRLRTAGYSQSVTCGVNVDGSVGSAGFDVSASFVGIRPALRNVDYMVREGLNKVDGKWYYYKNGEIDKSYDGLAQNDFGWWKVKDGTIDFTFNGMAKNQYGWWVVQNGKVNKNYTGMAKNQYGWWYFTNGKINYKYVGLAKNQYGWWYITNGTVNFKYNGKARNQYGLWEVRNGKVVA